MLMETVEWKTIMENHRKYKKLMGNNYDRRVRVMTEERYNGQIMQYGLEAQYNEGKMVNVECKHCEKRIQKECISFSNEKDRKKLFWNVDHHTNHGNHIINRYGASSGNKYK